MKTYRYRTLDRRARARHGRLAQYSAVLAGLNARPPPSIHSPSRPSATKNRRKRRLSYVCGRWRPASLGSEFYSEKMLPEGLQRDKREWKKLYLETPFHLARIAVSVQLSRTHTTVTPLPKIPGAPKDTLQNTNRNTTRPPQDQRRSTQHHSRARHSTTQHTTQRQKSAFPSLVLNAALPFKIKTITPATTT